ncbi:P1 family peptidase [Actinoplanes teichomyceticus]|uniref:L-aminopeptidase/D-esterase-like protein n=1 Tax=Actinoplanes teichomyceticus TaxID=1867 RepID=A0A561WL85_ACTTI|nr:P1 family peptidase [Actinoplanes teichomyceticus]TWG24600.1 L-aminopeptidase/D-esterase-like protein [Actinoplanes teichomyceticus]GIF14737.1 peptidase S58 [Actinoplanes teichomyceticus]
MGEPQLLSAHAGNWTGGGTGVTVVLPPPGTVGSGEVRGGAPATREFDLLHPLRLVDRVDAVVLSGGSAFGLAAADGVMGVLRARGLGYPTALGPVPVVVGMSIFDASVAGRPPTSAAGRAAALAALRGDDLLLGTTGAGAGAATGGWRGRADPGGLGRADAPAGPARVTALVVVNAWGDVLGRDGRPVFGGGPGLRVATPFGRENTTIAVVLTDARLDKTGCHLLAQSGHTGFARALHPAHSRYDGDAVVALATGEVTAEVDLDLLRAVTTEVMVEAVRAAVTYP